MGGVAERHQSPQRETEREGERIREKEKKSEVVERQRKEESWSNVSC